jgi:hypothetical protein
LLFLRFLVAWFSISDTWVTMPPRDSLDEALARFDSRHLIIIHISRNDETCNAQFQ